MKKREVTIPTLVGLFVTIAGLVTGIWLVKNRTGENALADAGETPKEVRISNIADSGFSVSWTTDKSATGFIQYGEGGGQPEIVVADDRDQMKAAIESYFTHYVTLKSLKPETNYKFKIGSGKNLYDLNGQPYDVRTATKLTSLPAADVAYGQVNTKNGDPAEGAIVYLQLPQTSLQSALVKASGSWVAPLSTARTTDLKNYAQYDIKTDKLEIQIQGGPLGMSKVTTDTGDDSPVPNLILGEDFTATPAAAEGLSVLTPQQGEKVNSTKPEIIGKAPPGANITIEVHSDLAVTGNTTADSKGNFSYSVPTDLPPGEHTVTVTTIINGVSKSITKTFTVYAAGESTIPAFSATPSGQLVPTTTLKPTPLPTKPPKPTLTITPTPTLRPTGIPVIPTIIPTVTPTFVPLPTPTPMTELATSGDTDMTLVTLAAAGLLIVTGIWWYRKAV